MGYEIVTKFALDAHEFPDYTLGNEPPVQHLVYGPFLPNLSRRWLFPYGLFERSLFGFGVSCQFIRLLL